MELGGGGACERCKSLIPDCLTLSSCPLLEKSSGNPYLKILDFSQLFMADAPMQKKSFNPRAEHFWDTQYKNILNFFALIKKSSYKP